MKAIRSFLCISHLLLSFLHFHSSCLGQPHRINANELKITAHRNAAGMYIENSLNGVKKALQTTSVDRIEIDVRLTQDSVLVLMHDATLDRTTNGEGKVSEYTCEQLRDLQLLPSEEKIPRLAEILPLFTNNPSKSLLIEIKTEQKNEEEIAKKVVQLIRKHDAENQCIIQSFDSKALESIHQLSPTIRLHQLMVTGLFYPYKKRKFIQEYSLFHPFVRKRQIKRIHQLGKKVNVWTVNQEKNIRKVLQKGVDGIITDYPERVLDVATP